MPTYYLLSERHTLASALREALEAQCAPSDFVACTLAHPLDQHLEVDAPSISDVRGALLTLKETVARTRHVVMSSHTAAKTSATPG